VEDGPLISCQNVWKIFRIRARIIKALQDVTLEVRPGTMVSLRGPSGSGKSTLLNLIGGLSLPTTGEVRVADTDVAALGRAERGAFRRAHIGYVLQELVLVPHLSALENVALALAFDTDRRSAVSRSADLLDQVGLSDRSDHRPRELSFGERQRVAVARAAVRNPRIILADEPTANLDDANADRVIAMFRTLREGGTAIVAATHDPRLAAAADGTFSFDCGVVEGPFVREAAAAPAAGARL